MGKNLLFFGALFLLNFSAFTQTCIATDNINDDFESYTAGTGNPLPDCWNKRLSDNQIILGVRNTENEANSGENFISIYTFFAINSTVFLISPELNTIDGTHQANFYINSDASNTKFEYGTLDDLNDISTYESLSEQQNLNSTYLNVQTGAINSSSTNAKYFVLKISIPNWHNVVRIDDFIWEPVTVACHPPSIISLTENSPHSLTLAWNTINTANEYEIEYGETGFILGEGIQTSITDTTTTLNNLESNTTYDVYIKSNCESGYSDYSPAFHFTTSEETTVGIYETFLNDNLTVFPNPISSNRFYINNKQLLQLNLDIYALDGKHLVQQKVLNSIEIIDIQTLEKGVYILKLSDTKSFITKKIVIQ